MVLDMSMASLKCTSDRDARARNQAWLRCSLGGLRCCAQSHSSHQHKHLTGPDSCRSGQILRRDRPAGSILPSPTIQSASPHSLLRGIANCQFRSGALITITSGGAYSGRSLYDGIQTPAHPNGLGVVRIDRKAGTVLVERRTWWVASLNQRPQNWNTMRVAAHNVFQAPTMDPAITPAAGLHYRGTSAMFRAATSWS
ncbi:hypothetical protein BH23CHL4_BH23CHL4_12390 [soil metagenome]